MLTAVRTLEIQLHRGNGDLPDFAAQTARSLTVDLPSSKVRAVIHRDSDGVHWTILPEFAPLLDEVLRSPGELVKASPVKRVTRHHAGGSVFYIKRYLHHAVALRPLKYLFKPTQAREEWDCAQALEARVIPIVRHVALGERRTWCGIQESILVTQGFDGVEAGGMGDLDATAVVRFVEQMHERGVVQEDLHLANLLVRREPMDIRLVDLHGIKVFDQLTAAQRQSNLALLRVFLPFRAAPEIEAQSRELRKRLFHERSWRCLRRNRDFSAQRHDGLKWQVRIPLLNAAALRVLADPDGFLQTRATILKPGRTSTVGKADGLVLKRFNFRKVQNLFKDLFRRSRAERAFQKAYHLELVGVPTARPVAAAQRRVCGVLLRSYILMEELRGVTELGAWIKAGHQPDAGLVRDLARLIARLHDEGFSHRDLKFSNIVIGADRRLSVLDLDGLVFVHTLPESRAAGDLERFARAAEALPGLSARWRPLFVRTYCRARRLQQMPRSHGATGSFGGQ